MLNYTGQIALNTQHRPLKSTAMLRNYLLIALRQFWKHRLYSSLNMTGLVAGVVCFLLITLYIAHDLRFDHYHEKKDRIYRLGLGSLEEGFPSSSVSGGVMPHTLQENYAGIEKVVRFRKLPSLVAAGEKAHFEEKFFFTDSTVFDVFSFPLAEGDARTALTDPYTLALTESAILRPPVYPGARLRQRVKWIAYPKIVQNFLLGIYVPINKSVF